MYSSASCEESFVWALEYYLFPALIFDPPSLFKTSLNCGWRLKFSFRLKELTDGKEISIKVFKRWDKCLRGEDDITFSYIVFHLPCAQWKTFNEHGKALTCCKSVFRTFFVLSARFLVNCDLTFIVIIHINHCLKLIF